MSKKILPWIKKNGRLPLFSSQEMWCSQKLGVQVVRQRLYCSSSAPFEEANSISKCSTCGLLRGTKQQQKYVKKTQGVQYKSTPCLVLGK
jgi:hypothetical protein